jgi:hypothetical protein
VRHSHTLLAIAFLALSACQSHDNPPPNTVEMTQSQATVFSISPDRWEVSLDTATGRRNAYWTDNTVFIRGQQATTNYTLRPGARIEYRGVENRGETWLRIVWILKD